jgi:hypothetical protein
MSWKDDPATEKQLNYLKQFGFVPEHAMTKGEASALISQFSEDPGRQRVRDDNQAGDREANMAYGLRIECESAKRELDAAGKGEIRDAKMFLRDAQNERLDFWQKALQPPDGGEVYQQPIKLYLGYGYRFKMPSSKHLQDILDALDAESATWDKDMPERFFQTLELNFPDLLRKNPNLEELASYREIYGESVKQTAGPSVKPKGCLLFLVACGVAFMALCLLAVLNGINL